MRDEERYNISSPQHWVKWHSLINSKSIGIKDHEEGLHPPVKLK
jgi:hypothetical protein